MTETYEAMTRKSARIYDSVASTPLSTRGIKEGMERCREILVLLYTFPALVVQSCLILFGSFCTSWDLNVKQDRVEPHIAWLSAKNLEGPSGSPEGQFFPSPLSLLRFLFQEGHEKNTYFNCLCSCNKPGFPHTPNSGFL